MSAVSLFFFGFSCFSLERVRLKSEFSIGHLGDSVDIDCDAMMNHSYLLKGFNRWASVGLTEGFDVPDLIELRHCTNSTYIYTHVCAHNKGLLCVGKIVSLGVRSGDVLKCILKTFWVWPLVWLQFLSLMSSAMNVTCVLNISCSFVYVIWTLECVCHCKTFPNEFPKKYQLFQKFYKNR